MTGKIRVGAIIAVASLLQLIATGALPHEGHGYTDEAATPDESRPDHPPTPLTLTWCIGRARAANPSLEHAAALALAATERIVPAGALEDPRLAYEASNVPVGDFDFRSTPMSGHQFGLRQKLPFPGLLSGRGCQNSCQPHGVSSETTCHHTARYSNEEVWGHLGTNSPGPRWADWHY